MADVLEARACVGDKLSLDLHFAYLRDFGAAYALLLEKKNVQFTSTLPVLLVELLRWAFVFRPGYLSDYVSTVQL